MDTIVSRTSPRKECCSGYFTKDFHRLLLCGLSEKRESGNWSGVGGQVFISSIDSYYFKCTWLEPTLHCLNNPSLEMTRKGQKSLSINRLQINNPLDMVKSFLLQLSLLIQDHHRFMIQKRQLILNELCHG